MKYFAYGSNMLSSRLIARVPARSLGMAILPQYTLRWDYHSLDGSGKCNIVQTGHPADAVYGVVYEMDKTDFPALDAIERGYDRIEVLLTHGAKATSAWAYIYSKSAEREPPYDWYKNLVVEGAIEHLFPAAIVEALRAVPSVPDPQADRPSKLHAERLVSEAKTRSLNE